MSNDVLLKLRFQRILWNMGFFVRIEVPLSAYIPAKFKSSKRYDITDLDVLGIRFDYDMQPDYIVCDCKSGERVKLFDRVLWLKGIMEYFGAKKGYLGVTHGEYAPREVASKLNILVVDEADLLNTEKRLGVQDTWFGSCDPNLPKKIIACRRELRKKHRREINYLIYRYWMEPDFYQIKRLITLGKALGKKQDFSSEAYRWIIVESIVRFTLSLCLLSSKLYNIKEDSLAKETSKHLYGGFLSKKEREELVNSIWRVIYTFIKDAYRGEEVPIKLDFFKLDPEYLPSLIEIIWRLVNQPAEFRSIPRFVDIVCYEYILKNKPISMEELSSRFKEGDTTLLAKLTKDIIEFYLDTTSIDKTMFRPLLKS